MKRDGCSCQAGNLWRGVVAGLIGGAVGSWTMELFQAAWNKVAARVSTAENGSSGERSQDKPHNGAQQVPATVKVASIVSRRLLRQELSEGGKKLAAPAVHYAFGTTMGGLYGALAARTPKAHAGAGLPFGFALWLAADEVALPTLGVSKPPTEYPLSMHAYALASHLVYGLTTELVRRAVCRAL